MTHAPDALCRSIMSQPAAVLEPSDTLRFALQTMVQLRTPALPVVDTGGRYLGMLARSRLIARAMPSVLSHQDERHPLSHFLQVGFITDTLADLQARLDAVADDPVSRHLDTDVPVLQPDTPLMNAMLFLYRQRSLLPVVDDGRLVGIVSVWDVLGRIGGIK